jgi:hypothetical protein
MIADSPLLAGINDVERVHVCGWHLAAVSPSKGGIFSDSKRVNSKKMKRFAGGDENVPMNSIILVCLLVHPAWDFFDPGISQRVLSGFHPLRATL